MIVRELTTRLGFDADDAQARRYADSIRTVRRVAIAATAAVSALAGGTLALSRSLARQGDEIAKAAVEAGLAEDQFQRLSFAIGQVSRVSERQAEQALLRLNDTIGRARIEGGRYAESLERLGFSQEEIQAGTIDNEEAFSRVVTELGNTENAADAAALASRVLGERVGRQLGPALRESGDDFRNAAAEVAALGGGFSQVASQSAEQLTDSFARVGIITRSLRSEIAEQLLPVVNDLVTELTDWFSANREIILQNFRRVVAGFITVLRGLTSIVRSVAGAVNRAAQAVGGWETTIRLLVSAVGAFIALKLAGVLFTITRAVRGLATATGILRFAMLLLSKTPVIAAFATLVFLIDNLRAKMQGAPNVFDEAFKKINPMIENTRREWEDLKEMIDAAISLDRERFLESARRLFGPMFEAGQDLGRQLRDGIRSGIGDFIFRTLFGFTPDADAEPFLDGMTPRGGGRDRARGGAARDAAEALGFTGVPNMMGLPIVPRSGPSVNVNANFNIDVPPGTTEQQQSVLQGTIERVFDQRLDRAIRQSMQDFQPQE